MGNDLVTRLIADSKGFDEGINHAQHLAQHFGGEMKHFAAEVAAVFGVGLGLERGVEAIKGQIEAVTELSHLSERTGIDVNDLQALQREARQTGVEFESLQRGITKMTINIAESVGGGEKKTYFKQLGLDVEEMMRMSPIEKFNTLAGAIAGLKDPADKVHLAFEIFGKSGAELINILDKGAGGVGNARQELERLGLALSPEDVETMKSAHEAMIDLAAAGEGLARSLASSLGPTIKDLTEGLTHLIAAHKKALDEGRPAGTEIQEAWGDKFPGFQNADEIIRARQSGFQAPGWDKGPKAGHLYDHPDALPGHDKESLAQLAADEERRRKQEEADEKKEWDEQQKHAKEAQRIAEQVDPSIKYKREVNDLFDNPFIANDTKLLGEGLADAAKKFHEEMERRDPLKKMKEEADKLKEGLKSNTDIFRDNVEAITQMQKNGLLTPEQAQAAVDQTYEKERKAMGLDELDKDKKQHKEQEFSGAYQYDTKDAYSAILKATQPKVDEYAKKQVDLQQRQVDLQTQANGVLQELNQKNGTQLTVSF